MRSTIQPYGHPDDFPLQGSLGGYKEFIASSIWQDLYATINDRITLYRLKLETASTLDDVRMYQGAISELRAMLDFPGRMITELESNQSHATGE